VVKLLISNILKVQCLFCKCNCHHLVKQTNLIKKRYVNRLIKSEVVLQFYDTWFKFNRSYLPRFYRLCNTRMNWINFTFADT